MEDGHAVSTTYGVSVRTNAPPWQRLRPLKTVAIFTAFVVAGVIYSILGPSVLSLEIMLDTTTKYISAGFTGNSLGYLGGAVLCGVLYSRLNKELLFMVSLGLGGAVSLLIGYSLNMAMYVCAMALQGFAIAFIDTGAQSYILKIWERHRFMPAVMQALHSMWSVGATIGPFIMHPFLADIPDNYTSTSAPVGSWESANVTSDPDGGEDLKEEVSSFRIGFLIASCVAWVGVILFLVTFILAGPSFLEKHRRRLKESSNGKASTQAPLSGKPFRIKLLVIAAFYYFFFAWIEGIPGNFLATFVVKGLGWKNDHGALITATYWGSHGIGRVLGIPLAMCFQPHQMVFADLTVTLVGFGLLYFVSYHVVIMWLSAVTMGLGIATLFASALLYIEKYVEVTGSASSVVIASASVGGMTAPLLTGFLMESYTYKAFSHICLASAAVELCIFIVLVAYGHKFGVLRQDSGAVRRDSEPAENDDTNSGSVEMKPLRK